MNALKSKNKYSRNNRFVKSGAGFTVIELLVSITIIAFISAVSFWNGRSFNDKISLDSVVQDLSLAVREAQNYGSTVRESSLGSGVFNLGYGIAFDSTHPTYAIVYIDTNGNNMYDDLGSCTGECIEKITFRNGVTIKSSGISATTYLGANSLATTLSFTFIRPALGDTIVLSNGPLIVPGTWASGQIVLQSPLGITKTLSINAAGQINIQ